MNKKGESNSYHGVSFTGVLLAVFIALKLAGVVNWSWWIVFIPLWIDLGVALIIIIILIIIYFVNGGPRNPWDFKY